jgi:hypothetical protein
LVAGPAAVPQDGQKATPSFNFAPHFEQYAIVISSHFMAGWPITSDITSTAIYDCTS